MYPDRRYSAFMPPLPLNGPKNVSWSFLTYKLGGIGSPEGIFFNFLDLDGALLRNKDIKKICFQN